MGGADVIPDDLRTRDGATPGRNAYDGAACVGLLSECATEDIPWILDKLFRRARSFVFLAAAASATETRGVMAASHDAHWWQEQMKAAARRVPGVAWTLSLHDDLDLASGGRVYRS